MMSTGMDMMRRIGAGAALLCACAQPSHVLKTRTLEHPVYMAARDFAIGVEFVEAGGCWTNVWMDVVVSPQSGEETRLDPMEFTLRSSSDGLTIKHTSRQFVSSGCWGCGCRDSTGRGTRAPSVAVVVKPGEIVRATLMFETGEDQARFLREFDLLYKGRAVHFGKLGIREVGRSPRSSDDDY